MIRWLGVLLLLVLAMAPAAMAQDPDDDAPDDEPEVEEIATPTPTPVPACERGSGTDGDYAYCPDTRCRERRGTDGDYAYETDCCGDYGDEEAYTDADYVYSVCRALSGGPTPRTEDPPPPPRSAVQPLAAQQLPLTGGEPLIIALMGFGFLLCGAGLRLRRTPSGPPRPRT